MSSYTFDWPNHPVFEGLSKSYIDLLARTASDESFKPRELIFHEGDEADKFFLVTQGKVAIEVVAHERGATGDHLVEGAAERVEVGLRRGGVAERLLGGHVGDGTEHRSLGRHPRV